MIEYGPLGKVYNLLTPVIDSLYNQKAETPKAISTEKPIIQKTAIFLYRALKHIIYPLQTDITIYMNKNKVYRDLKYIIDTGDMGTPFRYLGLKG